MEHIVLKKGDVVCVTGPTGSGKSTYTKKLCEFLDQHSINYELYTFDSLVKELIYKCIDKNPHYKLLKEVYTSVFGDKVIKHDDDGEHIDISVVRVIMNNMKIYKKYMSVVHPLISQILSLHVSSDIKHNSIKIIESANVSKYIIDICNVVIVPTEVDKETLRKRERFNDEHQRNLFDRFYDITYSIYLKILNLKKSGNTNIYCIDYSNDISKHVSLDNIEKLAVTCNILYAFNNAISKIKERGWNKFYIGVDIHETLMLPDYNSNSTLFYAWVKPFFTILNEMPNVKIILWSSCKDDDKSYYINLIKQHTGYIHDLYFNENPECEDTKVGNFKEKFYFNVLIEDKAGFIATTHGEIINKYLSSYRGDILRNLC